MRHQLIRRSRQLVLAVCGCTMVLAVAARAQQAPAVGANLVPVTASSLIQHPELYLNQSVSVYATVEQLLSGTAFSVDQDAKKASLSDLLIIAPTLTAQPKAGAYVTVVGVAIKFDPAEIQKRSKGYALDLAPNVLERYKDKVMVLAAAVVDPAMIDLAKVLPKPMTPAEEKLAGIMKQFTPLVAELRKGADGSDKAIVTTQAQTLGKLFAEVRTVFETQKDLADAVGWATEATTLMSSAEKAAAAGQFADVTASATKLTGLCQQCHAARRERLEDGTYRIKK
ncbi:MAG TPA: hypothetical protein VMZ90_12405 [Vicinamibacterales bacterium]|nr:hypothetical protein [Vicinamibacterales bacterium]